MRKEKPDFYLSTAGEYGPLADPRACWAGIRLRDNVRDDYMEIEIYPPLIGQGFGLGANDIKSLLITPRLSGPTLYPITQWPVQVYVSRFLDDRIRESGSFDKGQVELIAWGTIHRTLEEATSWAGMTRDSAG
jgi:hypothetical protein